MVTIKPLSKNIIAQIKTLEDKVGNILLPTDSASRLFNGQLVTVIAVGPAVKDIKIGQTLVIYKGRFTQLDDRTVVFQEDFERVIIGEFSPTPVV